MPSTSQPDARASKDERINLRVTSRQEQLIRRAAAATDRTLTDFVLQSVVERAQQVLADRRWFVADEGQWLEFQRLLDEPLPSTEKFARLARRPDPFVDPE